VNSNKGLIEKEKSFPGKEAVIYSSPDKTEKTTATRRIL
jgi:hypothetical protein